MVSFGPNDDNLKVQQSFRWEGKHHFSVIPKQLNQPNYIFRGGVGQNWAPAPTVTATTVLVVLPFET